MSKARIFQFLLFFMCASTGVASALVFNEETDKSKCKCEKKKEAVKSNDSGRTNKKRKPKSFRNLKGEESNNFQAKVNNSGI